MFSHVGVVHKYLKIQSTLFDRQGKSLETFSHIYTNYFYLFTDDITNFN
jgi:hypothetical protein